MNISAAHSMPLDGFRPQAPHSSKVQASLTLQQAPTLEQAKQKFEASRQRQVGKTIQPAQSAQPQQPEQILMQRLETIDRSSLVKNSQRLSKAHQPEGGVPFTPGMLIEARAALKPISQHQVLKLQPQDSYDSIVAESARSVVLKNDGSAFAPERLGAQSTLEIVGHGSPDGAILGGQTPQQLAKSLKQSGIKQLALLDLKSCNSDRYKAALKVALKNEGLQVGEIKTYQGSIAISRETGQALTGSNLAQTQGHDGLLGQTEVLMGKAQAAFESSNPEEGFLAIKQAYNQAVADKEPHEKLVGIAQIWYDHANQQRDEPQVRDALILANSLYRAQPSNDKPSFLNLGTMVDFVNNGRDPKLVLEALNILAEHSSLHDEDNLKFVLAGSMALFQNRLQDQPNISLRALDVMDSVTNKLPDDHDFRQHTVQQIVASSLECAKISVENDPETALHALDYLMDSCRNLTTVLPLQTLSIAFEMTNGIISQTKDSDIAIQAVISMSELVALLPKESNDQITVLEMMVDKSLEVAERCVQSNLPADAIMSLDIMIKASQQLAEPNFQQLQRALNVSDAILNSALEPEQALGVIESRRDMAVLLPANHDDQHLLLQDSAVRALNLARQTGEQHPEQALSALESLVKTVQQQSIPDIQTMQSAFELAAHIALKTDSPDLALTSIHALTDITSLIPEGERQNLAPVLTKLTEVFNQNIHTDPELALTALDGQFKLNALLPPQYQPEYLQPVATQAAQLIHETKNTNPEMALDAMDTLYNIGLQVAPNTINDSLLAAQDAALEITVAAQRQGASERSLDAFHNHNLLGQLQGRDIPNEMYRSPSDRSIQVAGEPIFVSALASLQNQLATHPKTIDFLEQNTRENPHQLSVSNLINQAETRDDISAFQDSLSVEDKVERIDTLSEKTTSALTEMKTALIFGNKDLAQSNALTMLSNIQQMAVLGADSKDLNGLIYQMSGALRDRNIFSISFEGNEFRLPGGLLGGALKTTLENKLMPSLNAKPRDLVHGASTSTIVDYKLKPLSSGPRSTSIPLTEQRKIVDKIGEFTAQAFDELKNHTIMIELAKEANAGGLKAPHLAPTEKAIATAKTNGKPVHMAATKVGYLIEDRVNQLIHKHNFGAHLEVSLQDTKTIASSRPDISIGKKGDLTNRVLIDLTAADSAGHILGKGTKANSWLSSSKVMGAYEVCYDSLPMTQLDAALKGSKIDSASIAAAKKLADNLKKEKQDTISELQKHFNLLYTAGKNLSDMVTTINSTAGNGINATDLRHLSTVIHANKKGCQPVKAKFLDTARIDKAITAIKIHLSVLTPDPLKIKSHLLT